MTDESKKLSRRRFLQFLGISGATLALPDLPELTEGEEGAQEAEKTRRIIDGSPSTREVIMHIDNPYWCVGSITKIEIPDPDNYGKFITVATIKGKDK